MHLKLSQIAQATKGELIGEDLTVDNFNFDSREMSADGFFVPLVIDQSDAHQFIEGAIQNGAVASFIDAKHQIENKQISYIKVADNHQALLDLAKWYRTALLNTKVIAVTGSNGKTTTKDMIASIVETKYQTIKTYANYNNEIGVSMTILQADSTTEMLVVEVGMDRPGQIDQLVDIVRPNLAVINMVGEAHLEFFKTQDKIADAKFEIVNHFAAEEKVFIYNADQDLIVERASKLDSSISKISFGTANGDFQAKDIEFSNNLIRFSVDSVDFQLNIFGQYNLINALAAVATTSVLGFDLDQQAEILANFNLANDRTEIINLKNGAEIVSDVYNANPTAMKLVIKEFANNSSKKKILVLGEMYQLGDQEIELHNSIFQDIDPNVFSQIFLVGEKFKNLFDQLKDQYRPEDLFFFETNQLDALVSKLSSFIDQETAVLIKGSHGVHLEQVVNKLKK